MVWNKEMLCHHYFSILLWNAPLGGPKNIRKEWNEKCQLPFGAADVKLLGTETPMIY
jgi:hypothetical protein